MKMIFDKVTSESFMIDLPYYDLGNSKPLDEVKTMSQAVQEALKQKTLYDGIGYICMWEEYRRTGAVKGESHYGMLVKDFLQIHGIDITKIKKQ
jgi:hypothetical protein